MTTKEYVEKNWKRQPVRAMAEACGVCLATIKHHCQDLGVDPIAPKHLKIAFILDHREKMTVAEMANELNCSLFAIYNLIKQIDSGEAFRD